MATTYRSLGISRITQIIPDNGETGSKVEVAASPQANLTTCAADVRRAIKARRDRDEFFPGHLFADAAWDMLLELYAADLDQIRLATSSLCEVSAVPATTPLRWISTLVDEGLIERHSDPLDARRIFVTLSSKGRSGMESYFQANAGM